MMIIISFCIYSCEDESNTLIPEPTVQLDSERFNWKNIEIPSEVHALFGSNPWMSDTDEVFIVQTSINKLFHYKGGNYNFIEFQSNIELNDIKGLSSTEGYLFGVKHLEKDIPCIFKWNGSTFIELPVNVQSETKFRSINAPSFVRNRNEMWISARGANWKFDGYNLTAFPLPDSDGYTEGFCEKNNKLKCYYEINDSAHLYSKVFEFEGNSWNLVYQMIQNNGYINNGAYYYFYCIGNSILMLSHSQLCENLYEFDDNNSLSLILSIQNSLPIKGYGIFYPICGIPPNNIIFYGYSQYLQLAGYDRIGHWNGMKFSIENSSFFDNGLNFATGIMPDSNHCCLLWDTGGQFRRVDLLFGTRKNFNKLK